MYAHGEPGELYHVSDVKGREKVEKGGTGNVKTGIKAN